MVRAAAMEPQERRRQILLAARTVFARRGYHRSGISNIVEEVAVARGTFYRYFDSKRAVFQAVLEEMMMEVVGVIRPIDVTKSLLPQIEANVVRLIHAITDEDVCRVLFGEALGLDEEGDDAMRAFYGGALSRIEVALRAGQGLGVVRAGDVGVQARMLLGLIKEPVVQASLEGRELDARVLAVEISSLLRVGLLTNGASPA
jgi:AcrR family transcriptional regulator